MILKSDNTVLKIINVEHGRYYCTFKIKGYTWEDSMVVGTVYDFKDCGGEEVMVEIVQAEYSNDDIYSSTVKGSCVIRIITDSGIYS